jgi:hypothetical protein
MVDQDQLTIISSKLHTYPRVYATVILATLTHQLLGEGKKLSKDLSSSTLKRDDLSFLSKR